MSNRDDSEQGPGQLGSPDAQEGVDLEAKAPLPHYIPAKVPPYMHAFTGFLVDEMKDLDPNVTIMGATLKDREAKCWANFQAAGRKRKKREKKMPSTQEGNVIDALETAPKVHPSVRTALRRKMATLRRIADELNSAEMREVLLDMNQIIAC